MAATIFENATLSKEDAELILQTWLKRTVNCLFIERLHGGMVNSVLSLNFDYPPYQAVIKISFAKAHTFESENYMLNYLRQQTKLPVPEMLHVWIFKEQHYIMRTERIAKDLKKLLASY